MGSFALLLCAFFGIAYLQRPSEGILEGYSKHPKAPVCSVFIQGAVKKPGIYKVARGSTVKECLQKSKPTLLADLGAVPLDLCVRQSMQIHVPQTREVKVFIHGEVHHCVELTLPVKTRVCELKKKIQYTRKSDLRVLNSRRYLRNGEKIRIPKKAVESNFSRLYTSEP